MHLIGFYVNLERDLNAENTNHLIQFLIDHNKIPVINHQLKPYIKNVFECLVVDDVFSVCQIVLSVGGDGTVLSAVRQSLENKNTICGINVGHLGFLCSCDLKDSYDLLQQICENTFQLDRRIMLNAKILTSSDTIADDAFNEILITKANYKISTIRMRLYISEVFAMEYVADGLIISTPTGSTAYSLSAGGSILQPNSDMIIITPIGCHSFNSRSIVIPASLTKIRIEVECEDNAAHLLIDGRSTYDFNESKTIYIEKSQYSVDLIKGNNNFYEILRKKL